MSEIDIYLENPYAFRIACVYLCSTDKKKSNRSEGYFRFTDYSLELYHLDPNTSQTNIIYIPYDDRLYCECNIRDDKIDNSRVENELVFESSSDQTINELTDLNLNSVETDDERSYIFPLRLTDLKDVIETVRKKAIGLRLRIINNILFISHSLTPIRTDKEDETTINRTDNSIVQYDFSVYEPNADDKPFCVERLDKIVAIFTQFNKLKITRATIDVYSRGCIVHSGSSPGSIPQSNPIGNPGNDKIIASIRLTDHQIKAFKSLGPIAPGSTVKIYLHYKNDQPFYLRMIFHMGYSGEIHTILPFKEEEE